jgi:hypothetical protein
MTARASDRARSSHGPRIRCALLTAFAHEWISPLALSCDEIDWLTLHPSALGLPASPNLFRLPVDDHADLVLLERTWYDWLQSHYPDRAEAVLARLERLGLAALDGGDDFALGFPPAILTRVRLLIKPQGLYRDRALYNYTVGAWHPGALWTEKVRPRTERYGDADLDKLRLSVPCFLMDVPALKRRARRREQGEARFTGQCRDPSALLETAANGWRGDSWPMLRSDIDHSMFTASSPSRTPNASMHYAN